MRALAIVTLVGACATEPAGPPTPQPLDVIWGNAIHPGDLIVSVVGTGGYTTLGTYIDAAVDAQHPVPAIDGRGVNAIVLEQAIAAMQRAGFADADISAGAVTLALWGAGVTKTTAFDYHSLGGIAVHYDVLGGTSVCAVGSLIDNLGRYNRDNLELDAHDLWQRTQAWLAQHPGARVTIVAHSWGGAVTEYVAMNRATFETAQPLGGELAFAVAAGVPAEVVGYRLLGPALRDVTSTDGPTTLDTSVYETDRPDDMVHNLNPSGDIESHQYDIVIGDQFVGSYGITTEQLSCRGVPGPCAN